MGFSTRRGRPPKKKELPKPKKTLAQNQEILDVLYKKSLITDEELWAGLHLRWLYTLKFGAPNIKAAEMSHFYGRELRAEDPQWQAARGKEYILAINELRQIKAHKLVMNIAIFDLCPAFLGDIISLKNQQQAVRNHREFRLVINGLSLLCKLWGRDNSRYHS